MKKLPVKIKGKDYLVLLCDRGANDWFICGIYADYKEALEVKQMIKDCFGKHVIKRCSVAVTLK